MYEKSVGKIDISRKDATESEEETVEFTSPMKSSALRRGKKPFGKRQSKVDRSRSSLFSHGKSRKKKTSTSTGRSIP